MRSSKIFNSRIGTSEDTHQLSKIYSQYVIILMYGEKLMLNNQSSFDFMNDLSSIWYV